MKTRQTSDFEKFLQFFIGTIREDLWLPNNRYPKEEQKVAHGETIENNR